MKFYPLADYPPSLSPAERRDIRAIWDGKPKRCPQQGEWYLSGAIVEAYRAPHNLHDKFHITQLVMTRTRTETIFVSNWEGENESNHPTSLHR